MTARKKATHRPRNTARTAAAAQERRGRRRSSCAPAGQRNSLPCEQPGPEPSADLIADAVARDRRADHDHHDHRQRGVPQAGRHPAQHGRGLTGDHEPHEQRVLDEHRQPDQQVQQRPWTANTRSSRPLTATPHLRPTGGRVTTYDVVCPGYYVLCGRCGRGGGLNGRRQRRGLEHEIIAVLSANQGPMTPGEVRDALGADLAYTTVMTVLSRLAEKGLGTRHRAGRAFAYQAVVDEDEIAARQMRRLLDTRDDHGAVLTRFVGALSDADERLLLDLLRRSGAPGDGGGPA